MELLCQNRIGDVDFRTDHKGNTIVVCKQKRMGELFILIGSHLLEGLHLHLNTGVERANDTFAVGPLLHIKNRNFIGTGVDAAYIYGIIVQKRQVEIIVKGDAFGCQSRHIIDWRFLNDCDGDIVCGSGGRSFRSRRFVVKRRRRSASGQKAQHNRQK